MTSETSSETSPSTSEPIKPFRGAQEHETEQTAQLPETDRNQPIQASEKAEGVFIGYQEDYGVPYVAQYFDIAEMYKGEPDSFTEVDTINDYIKQLISNGELDNTLKAVDAKIKAIEELAGVKPEERTVMKLVRLAEYCKFMNNIDNAKRNIKIYGRT